MDIDHWEQIKENVKSKFEVEDEGTEDLQMETQDGLIKQGKSEFLVAHTPLGKIKLAFETRPLVLDKKEHYSHRAGQAARTEYVFSDTEKTHKLKAYKWNDLEERWDEIDASKFSS
jgi:hypothetical protein